MEKATIKTIAKEAGVSIATVSKALNDMPDVSENAKARIREIARRQGYVLNTNARQLASGHSYSIGVILPDITLQSNALIYRALAARLNKAGYSVYLSDSEGIPRQEAQLAVEMLQKQVGVLIVLSSTTDMRHVEEAVKGQVPVIYIGGAVNPNAKNAVACDDYKGGMAAARLLFHRGSRRTAVLTWGDAATAQHERTRGFIAYMQEHAAEVRVYHLPGPPCEEAGIKMVALALAEAPPPEGVFATDDLIAIGALDALRAAGKSVPAEIQLIGYGDTPAAALRMVQLTTVAPPTQEIGICAGDMALGLIRNDTQVVAKLTLEPKLVRRATTRSKQ